MYKVIATAPTVYQYQSITKFGMPVKKVGNGSFTAQQVFNTEEEAKEYLIQRAEMYYDDYEGQVDEYIDDIERCGVLHIDAATARIVEIEDEEE